MNNSFVDKGNDCKRLFRDAYENRYTWEEGFKGYKGNCSFQDSQFKSKGQFIVGEDLKASVSNIDNKDIEKLISAQLWEVAIHRVKRGFDKVHGQNTFTAGDINEFGLEVLVGGTNKGDKYRIKENIVTMVFRHIHGKLIKIYTMGTIDTGQGYLSSRYTSQYFDPLLIDKPISALKRYEDSYISLDESGTYVLASRKIEKDKFDCSPSSIEQFSFLELSLL